jgi:hypothetical protein
VDIDGEEMDLTDGAQLDILGMHLHWYTGYGRQLFHDE